jgi:hypothetical protein
VAEGKVEFRLGDDVYLRVWLRQRGRNVFLLGRA